MPSRRRRLAVSEKAVDRGTADRHLGSGNHYLEIQVARAENVFDPETAGAFGIVLPDQVVVMFHCGSRGSATRWRPTTSGSSSRRCR